MQNHTLNNRANKLSLKRLLSTNLWGFILPVVMGVAASLAGVALLGLSGWFISGAGLATAIGMNLVFNYLTPGAIVRGLAILRTAGRYGEQVAAHNHLLGLLRTLRLWVWDQRTNKDMANLHQQSRGDLLQRVVGDVDQIIRWPLAVFLPWLYACLSYCAVALFAYFISPSLILPLSICGLLHLLVIPYLCGRYASHAVHVGQILGVHRRSRFISVFSALITLTIRGHWQDYAERLAQLDERQRRQDRAIQQAISIGRLCVYTVTILLLLSSFLLLADYQADTGRLALQEGVKGTWLVGFILALLAVNELVLPLVQAFVAQGQTQVGLRRLNQLQTAPQSVVAASIEKGLISPIQQLEFKQFRGYHAASNLGNAPIDLTIQQGKQLWIRGASGAGKSTLLAAIAGDCLATGVALVNQQQHSLYGNQDYQQHISYLPQSPYIFQQSIAANLRLGNPDASDAELWQVLTAVALAEWAKQLPNGLHTLLDPQGRNLSGGQRKRLALARLLLKRAPVLLLDEPFDGLDQATIEHICHALQNDYKPDILILVSHVDSRLGEMNQVCL